MLFAPWSWSVRRCRGRAVPTGRVGGAGRAGSLVIVLFALVAGLALHGGTAAGAPCWPTPVSGTVIDPFRAPECPWCAGNRGIEYAISARAEVRAAAPGEVSFSGSVAGVGYVVVRLDNGWRHTYGRLTARAVEVGERVETSTVLGRATHEFFFGLRVGDEYADPMPFIGRLVSRPRLVPTDGSTPRPTPPASVRCVTDLAGGADSPDGGNPGSARRPAV